MRTHTDFRTAAALLALVACMPGAASAQARAASAAAPVAAPSADAPRAWYGWQILLVDSVSILSFTMGALAGTDAHGVAPVAIGTGLLGYTVGAPIVHAAHGHAGRGAISLSMRLGSPLLGAVTGFAIGAIATSGCSGELCGLSEAVYGGIAGAAIGAVAAAGVDAAALAHEPAKPEPAPSTRVRWAPTGGYDPKRQMATVGIRGTF